MALGLACCLGAVAAEVIPPKPARYFNDYAKVVSASTAQQLDKTLEDFERATSSQILVAVFPKMQSDSSVADYTHRVAQQWQVGQKDKNNGAVLFVFINDRQMFIQVGYGLEGVLPDATAKRIVEDEIKPRFRSGDFNGGLSAGVNAILQATRGEYRGSGKTVSDTRGGRKGRRGIGGAFFVLLMLFIIGMRVLGAARRGIGYSRHGRSALGGLGWFLGGLSSGGGSGGGGWSSGGGGGGGFSSGGGSFGGGGAGGSW